VSVAKNERISNKESTKTMKKDNKDKKAHWRNWSVSNPLRYDGVRPARKNLKGKKEESELIAEKTRAFLEGGGEIEVHEQDFAVYISRVAYGYQRGGT
tara:strand:+ start:727 stop:1020 length:294 start_codon:yes stop_codon:yes gene_type:complete